MYIRALILSLISMIHVCECRQCAHLEVCTSGHCLCCDSAGLHICELCEELSANVLNLPVRKDTICRTILTYNIRAPCFGWPFLSELKKRGRLSSYTRLPFLRAL